MHEKTGIPIAVMESRNQNSSVNLQRKKAQRCGLTAMQFGVVMCVNLVIGFLTPPFGLNLFVGSSISGEPVHKIVNKAIPFVVSSLIVLMLITYCPAIIDFLPNLLK